MDRIAMGELLNNLLLWSGNDTRDPIATFTFQDQGYGIYAPSALGWVGLAVFATALSVFTGLVGALVYRILVEPRKYQKPAPPLSAPAVIWTFGVFLPFWIFAPVNFCNTIHINNKVVRFFACTVIPTNAIFRTTEALFGFTPRHLARSVFDFMPYYAGRPLLNFDSKTQQFIPCSPGEWRKHLFKFLRLLVANGLFLSCFLNLQPFFPKLGENKLPPDWYSWQSIFSLSRWKDTVLIAFLNSLLLITFSELLAMNINLVMGFQAQEANVDPMICSSSPSDFWGRRWNRQVHSMLKNGVYKPIRSMGGSQGMAIFASFFASGLFHEWLLPALFYDYTNTHGPTMLFFLWQAGLVAMEAKIGHWSIFLWMSKTLPPQLTTCLVIALGLPLGHFFCDSYIHSDFFLQLKNYLPIIAPLGTVSST